jgi:hypothetical protein
MGAIAIDLNNVVEVNNIGLRALNDALGEDGTRIFIGQYAKSNAERCERQRVTTAQIAEILEDAKVTAKQLSASGFGDFTKERHERPEMSFENISERLMKAEAVEAETWE